MAAAESFGQQLYQHRTGLVVGALIGLFSGGMVGLVVGAGVGFLLERGLRRSMTRYHPQQLFFRATFCVMGKVAKADGRVSENEIRYAQDVMTRMNLGEEKRRRRLTVSTRASRRRLISPKWLRPLRR